MRLAIDDGYTLPFATSPTGRPDPVSGEVPAGELPVVTGRYRPAVFADLQEYHYRLSRAATGRESAELVAGLVAAHVTDWDVTLKGVAAAMTTENVLRCPAPVVEQLVDVVTRWAPKEQDAAAGN